MFGSKNTKKHDSAGEVILMGHGGGGTLTRDLIGDIIARGLSNPALDGLDDAACVSLPPGETAVSTDSYVVYPLFFPGGDIGRLAVSGTVNDLTMQGARPLYLSLGLILEEGLPLNHLRGIVDSLAATARECGVSVITGDTKVVERRIPAGDGRKTGGMFINTTGIGARIDGIDTSAGNAGPGDAVIVTGTLGDHGISVLNARNELGLDTGVESDVAPLWSVFEPLFDSSLEIHCLRDPTRGGAAAALCDIARASSCCVRLKESSLPVREEVRGACDILGLEPLSVANEGKAVVVCPEGDAEQVISLLKKHPLSREARVIGTVEPEPAGRVLMDTAAGGERIVNMPAGESLPRIC
ncbi:MAG: hydrogenase expression/formation protein HypE [Kiritimatiellia bacterium]